MQKSSEKWDRQQITMLIDLSEKQPGFYDPKEELYRNKHARTEYLEHVAENLSEIRPGTTPTDVKSN